MKLIPDWSNKNLQCHFCGATKSVKYTMEVLNPVVDNKPTEVCVCNKCALRYNNKEIER
jgi:transcription elongation factor Elf1